MIRSWITSFSPGIARTGTWVHGGARYASSGQRARQRHHSAPTGSAGQGSSTNSGAKSSKSGTEQGQHRWKRFWDDDLVRFTLSALCWIPVGALVVKNGFTLINVDGGSMTPTFNPDYWSGRNWHSDIVFVNRWAITRGSYRRGDVVTMWSPDSPSQLVIKRIVALEGDIVTPLPPSRPRPVKIPEGYAWIEGDARDPSKTRDSNRYGPVPLGLIDGRVEYILWPWNHAAHVLPGPGKSQTRVKKLGKGYVKLGIL